MNNGADFSAYLQSGYVIEVIAALLLGLALIFLWRRGHRVDWPPASRWRRFLVCVGWSFALIALIVWCLLLWIVCEAWVDSVNPSLPKKPSLVFLIFGGMIYFALIGFSSTAFSASSGSARRDILKKTGRRES